MFLVDIVHLFVRFPIGFGARVALFFGAPDIANRTYYHQHFSVFSSNMRDLFRGHIMDSYLVPRQIAHYPVSGCFCCTNACLLLLRQRAAEGCGTDCEAI